MEGNEKPVFITVGSMAEHENSKNFQNLLMKTAGLISRKVIILTNWQHGNTIEGNVYKLNGFVSYPVILRKCALVVHHGGVGTLHNATEAGCPSIIIKYGHDQPYNAKVLFDLGISNGSINRKDLKADELAKLVNDALQNKLMKQKAEQIALQMQNENGVETAVAIIEQKMSDLLINRKLVEQEFINLNA
jgi:UDP:flavonoid glycosyltransferase YjiC (YdhE family)